MGRTYASPGTANARKLEVLPLQLRAMVLGEMVVLGADPMDSLDLVVRPASRTVTINPLNPNFPASVAKGSHTRQSH